MKQTLTYCLLMIAAIMVSFGFSSNIEDGTIHLKVFKEENGEKSVYEKVYADMDALKADKELRSFDIMVSDWIENHSKGIVIKKRIVSDETLSWIEKESNDEITDAHEKKIIKIKTDGEEKVYTITSEGEGEHKIDWIEEEENKTELTEEKIAALKEKNATSENEHKKIKVIISGEGDENKHAFMAKDEEGDLAEIEVKVEKEIDEDGNEVIKKKKVWITKDGNKIILDDENDFEFKTEGDKMTVIIDGKTLDIDKVDEGNPKRENLMSFKTRNDVEPGLKQSMNIEIKEKNGEKYIEIDIKRDAALKLTISEIEKSDSDFRNANLDFKNNLKLSQLSYYPNPNNGKFNLKFNLDSKDELTIKVMDILGNEVYNEKIPEFNGVYNNEINLMGKKKGIYILFISQKKKALTRKILIE